MAPARRRAWPPTGASSARLRERRLAPRAETLARRVAADLGHVPPAPIAPHAVGARDDDGDEARVRLAIDGSRLAARRRVAAATTSDVMNSVGRSSRCRCSSAARSPAARSSTLASSDLPTTFALRSLSISTFTASRTCISRCHRPAARRRAARRGRSGKSARCTESSRVPGRKRHSSSAVIGRIGAISRARPSAMMYIAVCADRRAARVRRQRVEPVLRHVDVERAHVGRDQAVDRLRHRREVVRVVRAQHPAPPPRRTAPARTGPAPRSSLDRQRVGRRA